MRPAPLLAAGVAALTITLAACGGSSPSTASGPAPGGSPAGSTTPSGAADPNAPEVVAPGDIPDDQVFVSYAPPGATFSIKVPEGWSRATSNGTVTFTDKYNSVEVRSESNSPAPTVASVRATGLRDVATDPSFKLTKVSAITRKGGPAILATYAIGSPPNAVTGKKALLAVERYVFGHNGTTVVLTLSGAKGADNVDPWRIVSDSLTWK
ncbi:MAG: lipoprotein [Acidimicrobiales bacterium]|nr:lipoprotein [Acidimicrobiales bacterium]